MVQAANDKEQIQPMLDRRGRLPAALGKPATLLADSGYFSQANVTACAKAQIARLIAPGRERHHRSWKRAVRRRAAGARGPDAAGRDGASPGHA